MYICCFKEKAENKGEKHLTTAGYASIISRSVKVDKWKPKPRQPFSIDNDSHLRWNRGLLDVKKEVASGHTRFQEASALKVIESFKEENR